MHWTCNNCWWLHRGEDMTKINITGEWWLTFRQGHEQQYTYRGWLGLSTKSPKSSSESAFMNKLRMIGEWLSVNPKRRPLPSPSSQKLVGSHVATGHLRQFHICRSERKRWNSQVADPYLLRSGVRFIGHQPGALRIIRNSSTTVTLN